MSPNGPPPYAALLSSHNNPEHVPDGHKDDTGPGTFTNQCHRLEPFSIVALLGGTALPVALLGFLIFLWTHQTANQDGQDATHMWRIIINHDWLIQTITLCTVVIRLCISTQTVICTSFVASLLFERQSFHVSDAVALSIFRGVNGGPLSFFGRFWAYRKRKSLLRLEVLALLLLTAGSIALQFSSTLLVSDVDTRPIVGFPKMADYNTTFDYVRNDYNMMQSLGDSPNIFPLFAQASNEKWPFEPNNHGVSNSGIQNYAMLPASDNRSSLRSYRGSAFVLTSQSICMQPVLDGDIDFPQGAAGHNFPIKGRINLEKTFKRSGLAINPNVDIGTIPRLFDCGVYRGYSYLCVMHYYYPYQSLNWDWENADLWSPGAAMFLMGRPLVFEATNISVYPDGRNMPSENEEWAAFGFPDKAGQDFLLSLCFQNSNITVYETHMSSQRNLHDRRLEYSKAPRLPNFLHTELISFLGADPKIQDADGRGIFDLKSIAPSTNRALADTSGRKILELQADQQHGAINDDFPVISPGCFTCDNYLPWAYDYSVLMDIIIRLTNRPSAALQILLQLSIHSIHDQVLSDFERPAQAQEVRTALKSAPSRYTGLISVVAIYTVTILCVGIITFLHMRRSRLSIIDNLWHTVSQVVSDATAEPLRYGNCSRDKGVAQGLSEDPLVKLERCNSTGYVRLVRVGGGEKVD